MVPGICVEWSVFAGNGEKERDPAECLCVNQNGVEHLPRRVKIETPVGMQELRSSREKKLKL